MKMQIEKNVSLKNYNTLQIPVNAKYLVKISGEKDLQDLFETDIWKSESHYILNGGANVLFTKDFNGIVLKIENHWKKIISDFMGEENRKYVIVECEWWENWSDFVNWTCENGLCWLENLIDIPWNVWTAPVSNIWAYGTEISKYVYEVEWIDLNTKERRIYKKSECEFAYRTSLFKHGLKENFLILRVRFLLPAFDQDYTLNLNYADIQKLILERWYEPRTPGELAEMIHEIRLNKLPDWHVIGTAWSFFANPIVSEKQRTELERQFPELSHHDYVDWTWEKKQKLSAGQLIDLCGLKWWRIENWKAGTYERHALILVNEWWTADDVLEAMHYIQKSVYDKFWVRLEPEVVLV